MTQFLAAAVQTEPEFGSVQQNVTTALELIPADVDLAVLPELFATGYQFTSRDEARQMAEDLETGPTCTRLRKAAAEQRTTIVAGVVEGESDRVFNTAVLCRPDGSWDKYRKIHLFWDEKDIFDPGDEPFPVVAACGTRIGLMICFDWVYPEASRALALDGATVICHPSNLVLPYCPDAMITRSIENRIYSITTNRVGTENRTGNALTFIGLSQIIGPTGERLAACGGDAPGVATAAIDPRTTDKQITPRNNLWEDRRPEFYKR